MDWMGKCERDYSIRGCALKQVVYEGKGFVLDYGLDLDVSFGE